MYCQATNSKGQPCKARAMSNGYCYRHNPDIPAEIKRLASVKGGKAYERLNAKDYKLETTADLKTLLADVINDTRAGIISPRICNAISKQVELILQLMGAEGNITKL